MTISFEFDTAEARRLKQASDSKISDPLGQQKNKNKKQNKKKLNTLIDISTVLLST